ncbi:MAG: tricorn protease [Acidobacteriota bacterium]|nr:tricorn protease [Acidobacteriota bacterium]
MHRTILPCLILLLLLCTIAEAQQPMLIGRVAINRTHIAFAYAGDIWLVERSGGEAKRIGAQPGSNNFPAFSPDGSQLAYASQTGNSWDVYVSAATGGEARRLTFHPNTDFPVGWTPDGKSVLFSSNRSAFPRLYTINAGDPTLPAELPLPKAQFGSFSPDGKRIAYSPMAATVGDWRFYRGGSKGLVWLVNLSDGALERLPPGDYNDLMPMWVNNKIYFISDRTGTYNLYSYDLGNKQTKQLTTFDNYGIRWAAATSDAIVFVRDGRLNLFDLASNQARVLDVKVTPDLAETQSRTVNASRTIEWGTLSSNGDRVVLSARGDVFIFDPKSNEAKDMTQTSGAAERWASLSPDGKQLAYFSDESGEYQLHVRLADGSGTVKKIAIEPKPSFYRELTWSPDSKKIAFADKRLALWFADVESGAAHRVDTSTYSFQEEFYPAWSPDSRYLTYSKHLRNRVRTVYIYELEAGRAHQITDGRTHTESPAFDASGKYLYFLSSPNAGTSEFGWGVLNGELARPLVTRRIHMIVLQNGELSPLLPSGNPNPEVKLEASSAPSRIDFDEIERRVVDLPTQPRDYARLIPGQAGQLFVVVNEWPKSAALGAGPSEAIYVYDLTKPPKFNKLVEDIGGYEISGDGKHLLYVKERNWFLVSTDAPPKPDEGKLDFKSLEVKIDPRAEWQQMYREAWRIMRDWFYDPNHHGQNLPELERHYAEYLPTITRRADLNGLLNMMLGHISVSHLGVGGGDAPQGGPPPRIGLLGADYEIDGGRYRFKRIYRSTQYNSPSGSSPAPLDRPGAVVREGEYLLAVEDQSVETTKSVYSYFDGKVSQPVKIKVGPSANGEGARSITVFPMPNESQLRQANWAEENRRRVEQLSNGKLGYIYVSNYGPATVDFMRGLVGYADRPGVVIDQRFNGGGITPDYLIEWLRRKPIYYYMFREGDDIATPVNPGPAAKVLIVNENNFSAAETFAFMYKLAHVGPIVGARTGGGGIGPYVFTPGLIDGGSVQLPNRAAYNPDGSSFGIENSGVTPDYEVEVTPRDFMAGRDPQLEKAVQVALAEAAKNPIVAPKRPKYPVHK